MNPVLSAVLGLLIGLAAFPAAWAFNRWCARRQPPGEGLERVGFGIYRHESEDGFEGLWDAAGRVCGLPGREVRSEVVVWLRETWPTATVGDIDAVRVRIEQGTAPLFMRWLEERRKG